MGEVVNAILKWLKDNIPWQPVIAFIRALASRQPIALLICFLLILVATGMFVQYAGRSQTYEDIVVSTLECSTVPTPQNFKGLDAFVMSNVPAGLDTALAGEQFNSEFVRKMAELNKAIATFSARTTAPHITVVTATDARNRHVFTNPKGTPGYLFVPEPILHVSSEETTSDEALLDKDPTLKTDIAFTDAIAPLLQNFVGTSITFGHATPVVQHGKRAEPRGSDLAATYLNLTPTQVYVITKNGVLRIFNRAVQPNVYRAQFPATTFFPDRPYFWTTFDNDLVTTNPQSGLPSKIGEYFVISRPYMDLGGNGIVMTLSRGLSIKKVPQAIVCFDFAFLPQRSLTQTLTERVVKLDGVAVSVQCTIDRAVDCRPSQPLSGGARVQHFENDLIAEMQRFFQQKTEQAQRSEIFGSMQRINDSGSGELHVSVPIEERDAGDSQVGQFLLFSLDLPTYRLYTTLYAIGGASAVGIMTLLLAYFWGVLVRRQHEYEEAFAKIDDAFDRVAEVMALSPTPYARVDGDDHIRDLNESFADVLGYQESALRGKRFEDLVASESMARYHDMQERRRKGEHVEPYPLSLQKSGGGVESLTVVSAAIPRKEGADLPETFGIFLHHHFTVGKTVPFIHAKHGQA